MVLHLALWAALAQNPCVLLGTSKGAGDDPGLRALEVRLRAEVAAAVSRTVVLAPLDASTADELGALARQSCGAALLLDFPRRLGLMAVVDGEQYVTLEEQLEAGASPATLAPRLAEALRAALLKVEGRREQVSRSEEPRTSRVVQPPPPPRALPPTVCRFVLAWLVCSSTPGLAIDVAARLEGGASIPLTAPQTDYFVPGPEVMGTLELGLHRYFDLEAQVGWVLLPSKAGLTASGTALSFGVGARGKAPLGSTIVWLEGLAHFNRTGAVNIGSTSGALGVTFHPLPALGLGPYVRVMHVFAPAAPDGFAASSATLLSVGLSLELGNTAQAPVVVEAPVVVVPPVNLDPDGDGLSGAADHCPDEAEDKDGYRDDDGCPDRDNDGDGVQDPVDQCPNVKGSPAQHGCPVIDPDTDGDGLTDGKDDCPLKPGPAATHGCPNYKQVTVTETKIEIDQKIFFAFGKTTIMPRSFPLLEEVALALTDHSRLCVRIEGHTDSVGNAQANRTLSDGRARAVLDYLTEKQVSGGRMSSKGYGADLPLESNGTPEGRERNRRVEFVIVPCQTETP